MENTNQRSVKLPIRYSEGDNYGKEKEKFQSCNKGSFFSI